MAPPFEPYSRIASMVYCEQEGKYLQRGVIFAEMKICQNLIGAIKIFLIAVPQFSWLPWKVGLTDHHGNYLCFLRLESQDGCVAATLANNRQRYAAIVWQYGDG
jgi:hypothetical protein